MTLNAPLSVRMSDGTTDRHVTRYASGLSFAKAAQGGHQACQFRLNLPRNTFTDLGPQDRCWIYDGRTARTVFGAAYLENPTPTDGPSGQAFDISAFGGMVLANDESRPLVYATRDLGDFVTATDGGATSGEMATGDWDPDPTYQRVRVAFPNGTVAGTFQFAGGVNDIFARAGMNLGGLKVTVVSGIDASDWKQEFSSYPSYTSISGNASTTPADLVAFVGDNFPEGDRAFAFRIRRASTPTNVATDTIWTDWVNLTAIGQRMDRRGALISGSAGLGSATGVLASQVVEDLLGRVLTMCDPATAVIEATTFEINQLSYPDGIKAASVLTDLEQWESDHYWGVGADGPTGLHEFWYRQWSTEPRYVVSVADGWRQTGSDSDLCNRILVSWTDAAGKKQTREITASELGLVGIGLPVDALGSRIKDADPVSLPTGQGSEANAIQYGAAILRDKINPPLAGRVTVKRPIVDRVTGNEAMPWELEPGWPVLLQEPGYQLRCTQMEYDDSSVSTVLTLGRPIPTNEQRLARLARVA